MTGGWDRKLKVGHHHSGGGEGELVLGELDKAYTSNSSDP